MEHFLIPHTITSKDILDAARYEEDYSCVIGWSASKGHSNCDNISVAECSNKRCIFIEDNFSKERFKKYIIDKGLISKSDLLELELEQSKLL